MRLTPEQVAEEKKYLSELKERVWIGERGLTTAEQDLFDTIEALQQENKQLRTQVAIKDNVLVELANMDYDLHKDKDSTIQCLVNKALKGSDDYHNPADVDALKKAREELYSLRYTLNYYLGGTQPNYTT